MKQLNYKKGGLILLLFLFLLVFSSSAFGVSEFEAIGYWSDYGNDLANLGRSNVIEGDMTTISNTVTRAEGNMVSPLIIDIDNDGINEIVGSSGSYIKIYNSTDDFIWLEAEILANGSQVTQPSAYNSTLDNKVHIVTVMGDTFYDYTFNGTDINITKLKNLSVSANSSFATAIPSTKIKCAEIATVPYCFYGDYNGSVVIYNTVQSNSSRMLGNISIGYVGGTSRYFSPESPIAIENIDLTGGLELGFITNRNDNTYQGYTIYDVNDGIIQLEVDDLGSGYPSSSNAVINIMFEDIDGGTSEIITDYRIVNGGATSRIITNISNSDGTPHGIQGINLLDTTSSSTVNLRSLIGDFTSDTGLELCNSYYYVSNGNRNVTCINLNTGNIVYDKITPHAFADYTYPTYLGIAAADLNLDNYLDIVLHKSIVSPQQDEEINLTYYGNYTVVGDLNGDTYAEVISMGTNFMWTAWSTSDNSIPTLVDTFGVNPSSPVCNGSSVRFSAEEYDETGAQPSGTNYYNDKDTDQEQLIAVCYGNGTEYSGSLSNADPYVDCQYNTPGYYIVDIYLVDSYNSADRTQVDTVNINVITGTDCNSESQDIGEEAIDGGTTTTTTTPTSTGISTFLDSITGGDNNSKIFIGFMIWLIITISVMVGVASITASATAVAGVGLIAGLGAFIILTALGILPVWILILFFIGLILLVILKIGFGAAGGS